MLVSRNTRKLAGRSRCMKRYGNLWSRICDRQNIEEAANNALKGKSITRERQYFIDNREVLLDELQEMLINETYRFSFLKYFKVFEPKERNIHHSPFYPDKILHHAIMNVCKPLFLEKMTADTYGSIKGRGITMAANKLKKALTENPDWYYLQIDCKKFYPSIDHDVCKDAVRRVIKCKQTLKMFDAIIDVHEEGLAIGVYPSQYLANLVLSRVDHWAKEVARVKHYFRYMDDILILVEDKQSAHNLLALLKDEIAKLKLQVKDNSRIAPVVCGIDFIGYKFYPTHTKLRKSIKMRMQSTVRRLRKKGVSDEEFKRKTASHFGWCKHANCRHLLRKTLDDKLYLYENNMEFKRLSELKESDNWFGLSKEKRVSIKDLFYVDIIFFEYLFVNIKGEDKVVVKFAYPNAPEDYHSFITRSSVIMDRLPKDKEKMPFIAQVKPIKNYTAYE